MDIRSFKTASTLILYSQLKALVLTPSFNWTIGFLQPSLPPWHLITFENTFCFAILLGVIALVS